MTLFGIAASTRDGSLNRHLFDRLAADIDARGHHVDLLDYAIVENLPLYTARRETRDGIPQEVQTIARRIQASQGLVIATPEYNFSIPGPLKNAIDWISRIKPSVLMGKPVLLAAASGSPVGGWRGLAALRLPLTCLGAQALPLEVTVGGVGNAADIDDRLANDMMAGRVKGAIDGLVGSTVPQALTV